MNLKTVDPKKIISILALAMLLISALPFTGILTTTAQHPSIDFWLDKACYHIGDTATISVNDTDANLNSYRIDDVRVYLNSTKDGNLIDWITPLTLLETDVDTGVFEESFTLVSEAPAAGELVVRDGGTINANYTDTLDKVHYDSATVDETPPTVTSLAPGNETLTADTTPVVSAHVDDAVAFDLAWLTLDGVVRSSTETAGTLSYQVLDVDALSEGVHNVTVNAQDIAGNINVTSWWFKVDTTKPTCTISMNVTSPVKDIPIEFTFEFNEDMNLGHNVTISGNATDQMTYDPPLNWTSARTYSANYTVKPVSFNGTVLLNVTGGDDLGGMTMVPANFTFYIDTIIPTTPENLTATAEAGANVLDWDAATDIGSGVASYNIYRNTTEHFDTAYKTGVVETSYRDITAVPETQYFYQVTAVDEAGNEGSPSDVVNATFLGAYVIELEKGWNLISLPLVPDNSSIEAVLGDVMVNVTVVWSYDAETGNWSSFKPGAPSELTKMVDGKGYWVNMTASATLTVYGSVLPAPPAVPPAYEVVVGWNLIGYKETTSMNASTYLDGIVYRRLYTYYDGTYHIVQPDELMVPGRGYWIAVTEAGTIYP